MKARPSTGAVPSERMGPSHPQDSSFTEQTADLFGQLILSSSTRLTAREVAALRGAATTGVRQFERHICGRGSRVQVHCSMIPRGDHAASSSSTGRTTRFAPQPVQPCGCGAGGETSWAGPALLGSCAFDLCGSQLARAVEQPSLAARAYLGLLLSYLYCADCPAKPAIPSTAWDRG